MAMMSWLRWPRRTDVEPGRPRPDQVIGIDGYVDELSDTLYQQTLGEGGWAVDIGVYGPGLFRRDARRMVQEIALSGTESGPPTP
jgi:hypothetical protein